jgi:hypothetical protein
VLARAVLRERIAEQDSKKAAQPTNTLAARGIKQRQVNMTLRHFLSHA